MTKQPAGNTGRHLLDQVSDYVATPAGQKAIASIYEPKPSSQYDALWDRLRADLSNLGAAYGELPGHSQTTTIGEMTGFTITKDFAVHVFSDGKCYDCGAPKGSPPDCPGATAEGLLNLTEPDLNLYYDGIILAARKKREALAWMDEPLTDDERDICHKMWGEQERAERVASALSKPLDHEPRLGWKPGDGE